MLSNAAKPQTSSNVGQASHRQSFLIHSPTGTTKTSVQSQRSDLAVSSVSFAPSISYSSGGLYPLSVAIADLNHDGIPDLVVLNQCADSTCGGENVGVLLGNGDGTFQTTVSYSTGGIGQADSSLGDPASGPNAVVVADVNGDGIPDILAVSMCLNVANCSTGGVAVLLGNGDGTFEAAVNYNSGGSYASSLAVADLNGDGKLDIVVSNQCLGDGCGISYFGNVGVLLGNGDGTFQDAVPYGPTTGNLSYGVAIGDMNGDGIPDLILTQNNGPPVTEDGFVSVMLGNGDGTFQVPVGYDAGGYGAYTSAIGDLNGDGVPDVVTANSCGSTCNTGTNAGVLLGNGDGTLQPVNNFSAGGWAPLEPSSVALYDMNGDGILDVVFGNFCTDPAQCFATNGTVAIMLGNGDGTLQPPAVFNVGLGVTSVAVADLNGDQEPDIVAVTDCNGSLCTQGAVYVLLNQGQTTLAATNIVLVSSPNPSNYPQPLTLTATVTGSGTLEPTGTVTFSSGATILGSAPLNNSGIATILTTTPLGPGTYAISSTYGGDSNFAGSTSTPVSQVVNSASSTCTLSAGPNPLVAFEPAIVSVGIAPQYGGTATGTVTFSDGGTVIGRATVAANTAAHSAQFAAGTHALSAMYSGDANVNPSQCSASQVVGLATSSVVLTASQSAVSLGQPASFVAVVNPEYTGATPTGIVTFSDGSTVLQSLPLTAGTITFTTSSLGVGLHLITATYLGDGNFSGNSATIGQLVTPVSTLPAFTSATSATFSLQSPGSFLVTTTAYPTATLTEIPTLPAGVTFTDNGNGTATLSGIPAAGTVGTYPITFTATNTVGAVTQSFTLIVSTGPDFTSGTSTTFAVGSPGVFTVSTTGTPTAALTQSGSLPTGVTFGDNGNGTGTLSGTPSAGTAGSYPITFSANNGTSSATQNFTLIVNQGPGITSASSASFSVGVAGTFLVTTTGTPVPALTESGSLPPGVTFIDNGNGTATIAGTPAAGSGGIYSLSLTAANGVDTNATQSFTLTIDQGLAITSGNTTTFTTGSTGWFSVTTAGFPPASLTESGNLPAGVNFIDNGNGTATLSGMPASTSAASYPITITASNGGISPTGTQNFTLAVNQGAAILTGNVTTFSAGTEGTFTVIASGEPSPALAAVGTLPVGVGFTDNGNGIGTFSGTPAGGSAGAYPITITAGNGVGSAAVQSFSLNVNQGPAITSENYATFTVTAAGSFTVTTVASPVAALTEVGALPQGVTFVDNGNGTATVSGTPASGTVGQYGFTIIASGGEGAATTQSFTLSVSTGLSFTSANEATFQAGSVASFTVTTSGSPAPSLTETGTLPSGIAFTDNGDGTATLAGIASTSAGGTFPLTFTAHNGLNPDVTQSFTLQITANRTTPVIKWANPAPIYQGEALGSTELNATANVPGTFIYSPAAGTVLPVGMQTLSVMFTPTNTSAYTVATETVQLDVLGNTPHTISGIVTGSLSSGYMTLLDNGANPKPIGLTGKATAIDFTLPQVFATGATYNVTVGLQPAGGACTVTNGSGTVGTTNVTNVRVDCTAGYSIGGTIAQLSPGQSLVLQDNGGDTLTIDNRTSTVPFTYQFKTLLAKGQTYDVTIARQPVGQICAVTQNTGTVKGNVTSVDVECGPGFSISGVVTGETSLGDMTLLDNGANPNPIFLTGKAAVIDFTLPQVFATGDTYNVTVGLQPSGRVCQVTNGSGTIGTTNVTNVHVNCSAGYSIGGTISQLSPGQSLVLQDNGGDTLTIDNRTSTVPFTFQFKSLLAKGQTYDVTIARQPGQICAVTQNTGTVKGNVTSVEIECGPGFSISGVITGALRLGDMTLLDNGANPNPILLTGKATVIDFTLSQVFTTGATFDVTVGLQPSGRVCQVTNGSGTVGTTNVTDVRVDCSAGYSIGGTISSLDSGQSLVLQDNGGDTLTIDNRTSTVPFTFQFKSLLAKGQTYDVTIARQPVGQICTVTQNTGTVAGNVTSVAVSCE